MSEMDATTRRYADRLKELINAPFLPFSPRLKMSLPASGGVYHIVREVDGGRVSIYVGQTNFLPRRLAFHHTGTRDVSTLRNKLLRTEFCSDEWAVTAFMERECRVQFIAVPDAQERHCLENLAISILQPEHNK